MLLENKGDPAPQNTDHSPKQSPDGGDCDVTCSSSQPASPAPSDVTGPLAGRLSDAWDRALEEARSAEPAVDDPLHRGMLVFWVAPHEITPSELPPVSLISVIGEDGTLTDVDYPLKIGDYTFLVPEEQSPLSSDSGSGDSDSDAGAAGGGAARSAPAPDRDARRQRRLLVASTDVTEGLYLNCPDFEQYARALLDAELTVVRNVLSRCRPDSDRQRSLLCELQGLCERRWREEAALDVIDRLGSEQLGNRGLIEFLVSHLRLLLQTQPELEKLQHALPVTLQSELLRIQTDFLASRIAARTLELHPEASAEASSADGGSDPASLGDLNPTPYGPFGSPPRPRRWGW